MPGESSPDLGSLPALLACVSTDEAVALADGWPQDPATPLADSPLTGDAAGRPADRSVARVRRWNGRSAWLLVVAAADRRRRGDGLVPREHRNQPGHHDQVS